jgi:hypothetical protein
LLIEGIMEERRRSEELRCCHKKEAAPERTAWTLWQAGGRIQIAGCHPFVFDAVATPVPIIEVRIP